MKKSLFAVSMLAGGFFLAAAEIPYVRAERESAVYKVGEKISFQVKKAGKNAVYSVSDGQKNTKFAPLPQDKIDVPAGKPGFVLVTIRYPESGKNKTTYAGAAVEPEKIRPGTTRPENFDAFWEKQLAELRKAPLQIKETPLPESALPKGFIGYDVEITRGDVTATGFLVLPKEAKKQSLPAVLTFLGASKVSAELSGAIGAAKKNALGFNLNFHGEKNLLKRDRAGEAPAKKKTAGYQFKHAENQQTYAMRKIFLRTVVAADYLRQRPEFDGKKLAVTGGSLGGCQAIVCAALVPEVGICISNATAMCDHLGAQAGHCPGWPNLLKRNAKAKENCRYFDVVNFASRVKCPVYMAVGFIDTTCPPASTYAAYNVLTTEKHNMKHSATSAHGPRLDKKDRGVFSFGSEELAAFLKR